jgi:histidyl-tRNA synthetase
MGSIGGGGRYDDLTGLFDVPGIPGVGISFGVDRIYDVLEQLNLFPATVESSTEVIFLNLGETESRAAYSAMQGLRNAGIRCEIYPDAVKLDKQFKYADKKSIPYAIIIGSEEIQQGICKIKQLGTGEQQTIQLTHLSAALFR